MKLHQRGQHHGNNATIGGQDVIPATDLERLARDWPDPFEIGRGNGTRAKEVRSAWLDELIVACRQRPEVNGFEVRHELRGVVARGNPEAFLGRSRLVRLIGGRQRTTRPGITRPTCHERQDPRRGHGGERYQ